MPADGLSRHRAEPLTMSPKPVHFPVRERRFYFVAAVTVFTEILLPELGLLSAHLSCCSGLSLGPRVFEGANKAAIRLGSE